MNKSTPPLLRGTGTLFILAAAVIAFCIARGRHPGHEAGPAHAAGEEAGAAKRGGDDVAALAQDLRELRAEVEEESVVEEVLDNRWFEWIGFAGTAIVAASFFAEAYLRREPGPGTREAGEGGTG